MKMFKKLMATALVCVMALTVMTACIKKADTLASLLGAEEDAALTITAQEIAEASKQYAAANGNFGIIGQNLEIQKQVDALVTDGQAYFYIAATDSTEVSELAAAVKESATAGTIEKVGMSEKVSLEFLPRTDNIAQGAAFEGYVVVVQYAAA